jgi:hypothetical protein
METNVVLCQRIEMKVPLSGTRLLQTAIFAIAGALLGGAGFASGQAISSVTATTVTNNSATITWTTDIASSSLVNYGATAIYGSSSTIDPTLVMAHSVTLNGLSQNSLYNFDVVSGTGGTTTTSANFRFATLSSSPVIADLNVIFITSNSVTINWTTDQPSSAMVNYGTTSSYDSSSPFFSTPAIAHSVTLSGLAPNTVYQHWLQHQIRTTLPSPALRAQVPLSLGQRMCPRTQFWHTVLLLHSASSLLFRRNS